MCECVLVHVRIHMCVCEYMPLCVCVWDGVATEFAQPPAGVIVCG